MALGLIAFAIGLFGKLQIISTFVYLNIFKKWSLIIRIIGHVFILYLKQEEITCLKIN